MDDQDLAAIRAKRMAEMQTHMGQGVKGFFHSEESNRYSF